MVAVAADPLRGRVHPRSCKKRDKSVKKMGKVDAKIIVSIRYPPHLPLQTSATIC
jgi:hypothetical protein